MSVEPDRLPVASVGVWYVTAVRAPGRPISELVVRVVLTSDVGDSGTRTVRHAVGFDDTAALLRSWMIEMCQS